MSAGPNSVNRDFVLHDSKELSNRYNRHHYDQQIGKSLICEKLCLQVPTWEVYTYAHGLGQLKISFDLFFWTSFIYRCIC